MLKYEEKKISGGFCHGLNLSNITAKNQIWKLICVHKNKYAELKIQKVILKLRNDGLDFKKKNNNK